MSRAARGSGDRRQSVDDPIRRHPLRARPDVAHHVEAVGTAAADRDRRRSDRARRGPRPTGWWRRTPARARQSSASRSASASRGSRWSRVWTMPQARANSRMPALTMANVASGSRSKAYQAHTATCAPCVHSARDTRPACQASTKASRVLGSLRQRRERHPDIVDPYVYSRSIQSITMYFMLDSIDSKAIGRAAAGRPRELGGPRHGAGALGAGRRGTRPQADRWRHHPWLHGRARPGGGRLPGAGVRRGDAGGAGQTRRLPGRGPAARPDPGVPSRRRRRRLPAQGAGAEPVGARVGAGRRAEGTPRHRADADDDRAGDGEGDGAAARSGRRPAPARAARPRAARRKR